MIYKLIKEYFFKSDERLSALLRLMGIVLGVIGLVALASVSAWWFVGFWAAMSVMSFPLFIQSMQIFVAIAIGYVALDSLKTYLIGSLTTEWRKWLTLKFIDKYTSEELNNYLDLARNASQLDNPAQRIQEDLSFFVDKTLKLGIGLLQSILTLATFLVSLWVVGGALSFVLFGASITIPGYLFFGALLFAALSTGVTHLIGRALAKSSNLQRSMEADFRKEIELLSNDAESIALDQGGVYYKQSLTEKIKSVCKNAYEMLKTSTKLSAFQALYQQFAWAIPYIMAAPLYFAKKTSLGQLMEIGFSFQQVFYSLNWFSDSYQDLAGYKGTVDRIAALESAMKEDGLKTAPKDIVVCKNTKNEFAIRNGNLSTITKCMMRELSLTLTPGVSTLIKGRSGLGKSTLFKAMGGTWKYGSGEVSTPDNKKVLFLPQRPSLANGTLQAVLAYPEPANTYTHKECEAVLRLVGGSEGYMKDCILDLNKNTTKNWSSLSLGEQQRIAFARALLKKPDWLFLDEATSSLDEDSEEEMYLLMQVRLSNTTLVSIGHRSTVQQFHERTLILRADQDRKMLIEDEYRFFNQLTPAAKERKIFLENEYRLYCARS